MTNVYLDPFSYGCLSDAMFQKDPNDKDDRLFVWRYLQDYCLERNIRVHTIDFWNKEKATPEDIYVSFDHKSFSRKLYWRLGKRRKHPSINLALFKKRILFQGEPPTVHPEVYQNLNRLFGIYDAVYLTIKADKPRFGHYRIPRPYNDVLPQYWGNTKRGFLVMINFNKRTRFFRRFIMFVNRKRLYFQKDLLGERIKIIDFFSRTGDIDLYGYGWDQCLPLPYWFYKNSIQKAYKGSVQSKFQKLSEYNFAIAFENNITPGFIGEALFDCFYTGTVPIYFGAPDIQEYIPKECFIDMRDFSAKGGSASGGKNYEELRSFLKSLSKDDIQRYRENARVFLHSEKMKPFSKEHFAEFFVNALGGQ